MGVGGVGQDGGRWGGAAWGWVGWGGTAWGVLAMSKCLLTIKNKCWEAFLAWKYSEDASHMPVLSNLSS